MASFHMKRVVHAWLSARSWLAGCSYVIPWAAECLPFRRGFGSWKNGVAEELLCENRPSEGWRDSSGDAVSVNIKLFSVYSPGKAWVSFSDRHLHSTL